MNFEEKVVKYAELDAQEKSLKAEKKPLNEAIKSEMKSQGLKKYQAGDVKVSFNIQERSNMNEDKLLFKLKSLGLTEAIKTVEKPDEDVITQLVYEGKLSSSELEDCLERKFVEVLKVTGGAK